MNTRKNSTTDAEEQAPKTIRRYQSEYFSLPESEKNNEPELTAAILLQISKHEASLATDDHAEEKKSAIAADLVRLTKTFPLSLALNILIDASQHPLFLNSPAHQIITEGINKERSIYHSPLITGERTLAFVREYRISHQQEVDEFLVNPELLLMWINFATPLEISRLFQHFYHHDSKYYVQLRTMAAEECDAGNPGKALLCSTLMSHGKPTSFGAANIKKAATTIFKNERSEPYERTFKSLQFRLFPTTENMRIADECYINANKIELNTASFDSKSMQGASFANAKLDFSSFANIDLTGAVFTSSSLTGVNFNETKLRDACLRNANMTQCSLQHADLSNADLTSTNLSFANLQGANLTSANFDDANLEDAEFIITSNISQLLLSAELTRLHNMIKDHPQKTKLLRAICKHLINYTRTPEVSHATAAALLGIAKDHEIFGQHDELHYVKTSINYAISTYQSFYSTFQNGLFARHAPPADSAGSDLRYETREQKHLREEYEKRAANAAKRASNRPPMPDHPPPPVPH